MLTPSGSHIYTKKLEDLFVENGPMPVVVGAEDEPR